MTPFYNSRHMIFQQAIPLPSNNTAHWGQLYGASKSLWISRLAEQQNNRPLICVTPNHHDAEQLNRQLRFFLGNSRRVQYFPDWETLPYDVFSPHEDIVSERLQRLHELSHGITDVLIVPVTTLMQRLAPAEYLRNNSIILEQGETINTDAFRQRMEQSGYRMVQQVMEHGECAFRGSLIDLFPMGSDHPYRIDLFDDEIDNIKRFDPSTQLTIDSVQNIHMLPAHEFPMNADAISAFRTRYRSQFDGNPKNSSIYTSISDGLAPGGIEYYLPLFFDECATLFDYIPDDALWVMDESVNDESSNYWNSIEERHEQRRHDIERPILPPDMLFLKPTDLQERWSAYTSITTHTHELEKTTSDNRLNFSSKLIPPIKFNARQEQPARDFHQFINGLNGKLLILAESPGRREYLLNELKNFQLNPKPIDDWKTFTQIDEPLCITVADFEHGIWQCNEQFAVVPENLLFGERAQQRRRRKSTADADVIVRNLTDLREGAAVVHEEHGVGRYRGLQILDVNGQHTEFLTLEYAAGDKLYVPVSSLHLISRYTGADDEKAPLHRLGSEAWSKARKKAAEKAFDVAAELLDVHARRAAQHGKVFTLPEEEYRQFMASFPFEETADQLQAIDAVLTDMQSPQPMDRVVCGDVGFGKTEVAMRAAFIAVQNGMQVAVLVPTTLLAQQHTQNFQDRFADWPIRIESLSRFTNAKTQKTALEAMTNGQVDIVIGTHKLLSKDIQFNNLGLVIIDEEQRFGVRQKEQLKSLRAEVDLLTLTATPIPRTLNMSLAGLRDLSIIATPPVQRHAIKTFVNEWNSTLIEEACQRELRRGGQVFFLHNDLQTIEKTAQKLRELLPSASVAVAHGQMREKQLEQVMLDFYHQRFQILVCTTIIETGIDVPSANTIIMNRADKLGLAQLHQLRGRVGRSHHRAYAYLITPPKNTMTADAVKRLEAIESLEDLGVGFTLATHDMEIRGAGELLGGEQSGQIQEIGFTLYNELLDRAVRALKSGQMPKVSDTARSIEIELGVPALLPDTYVPDVHARLVLYKRIASAANDEELKQLHIELIDRFGLLPEAAQHLFESTRLKIRAAGMDLKRLETGPQGGRILFGKKPIIDPVQLIQLIQTQHDIYRLDGQEKLRFNTPLETAQQRIDWLHGLLDTLSMKEAA